MDVSQVLKLGKELGLEGKELLEFIERKERENIEREEKKENSRLKREDKKEKERLKRDERVKDREAKIKQQELDIKFKQQDLENQTKIRILELEHKTKLDMLTKEAELEKAKAPAEKDKTTVHHKVRGPKLPHFEEGKDDMDAYLHRFERSAERMGYKFKCFAKR